MKFVPNCESLKGKKPRRQPSLLPEPRSQPKPHAGRDFCPFAHIRGVPGTQKTIRIDQMAFQIIHTEPVVSFSWLHSILLNELSHFN